MSKVVRTRRKKNSQKRKNSIRRKNTLRRKNSVRRKIKRNYSKSRKKDMKNKRMKGGGGGTINYLNKRAGLEAELERSLKFNRVAQPILGAAGGAGLGYGGAALAGGLSTIASGGTVPLVAAGIGAVGGLAAGVSNYKRLRREHGPTDPYISEKEYRVAQAQAENDFGRLEVGWNARNQPRWKSTGNSTGKSSGNSSRTDYDFSR